MRTYLAPLILSLGIAACHGPRISQETASPKKLVLPAFNKEGHRGTRGLMPENTIPSMQKAIDLGVNSIEVDVVISGDGQVVISHDIYFHPDISLTPEGQPLTKKEAESRLLYKMNYDSIRKYDVGLKPHKDFPRQQKISAYKPLLSELIDSVEAYLKHKRTDVIYNIELKANPSWETDKQPPVEELVDLTMKVVKEKNIEHRSYLQSFDFRAMQVVHRKYPYMTTAILIGGSEKRTLDQQLADLGYQPEIYSPHYSLVTKELVAQCRARGIKLIPWTVNSKEEMKQLIALGVDGIITDYPDYFQEL